MWLLYLLSWLALIIQICFVTLSIAAGLFYLAELVEEFTVITGRIIKYMIHATSIIYVALLLFEDLPWTLIVCGLITNAMYIVVLRTFPYIELSSPTFILSILLIVANHYMSFSHFSTVWYPFHEVLAYFTVCLWIVPFALFVSLSANENVLPTTSQTPLLQGEETDSDIVSSYFNKKTKRIGLLRFLKSAQENLLPQRVKKGY